MENSCRKAKSCFKKTNKKSVQPVQASVLHELKQVFEYQHLSCTNWLMNETLIFGGGYLGWKPDSDLCSGLEAELEGNLNMLGTCLNTNW